ncbi:hypothetical protein D9619_012289 [Psilocybe cf. subviscida]|uniref:Uncharacterized protein n=1 Tax=Psilocybe cf. subviscida TaxID=2480587 RepID=A0A8H5AR88_9AGAR|nr:hypothetical protein D9619_012289 [Psilocybe cf. subviscida]
MLLFLVLCACLQTLRGTPLPPPLAPSFGAIADVSGDMTGGCPVAPDDSGQQLRSVFSILQSCLLTIFACVWTSAHPNINSPRDSWWTCLKRQVVTMIYAVISPEVILLWALNQRQAAKTIAEGYNKEFASADETQVSLRRKVLGLFLPLPEKTTWRGVGQLWTRTHGFFIQMGGFILYENGYPKEVLDYERLKELLLNDAIDAPTVTERELQDRSKGDAVSKAIVVLQTMWFVIQCIARAGQRLPLSELEVLTLAFAVMNAGIYGAWWNKPQGVDMAICVPLKRADHSADDSTISLVYETPSHPELANSPRTEHHRSNNLPSTPPHEQRHEENPGEQHSWLRRKLRHDCEQHSSASFFLVRLPYRIMSSLLRPLDKMGQPAQFKRNQLRVPIFYASGVNDADSLSIGKAASAFGIIFGAIHLLAWASHFSSPRDLVLWRVSATIVTVMPLLSLVSLVTWKEMGIAARFCVAFLIFLIPFYIASRIVLLSIALKAIHHPAHEVLLDIVWTTYIPHF